MDYKCTYYIDDGSTHWAVAQFHHVVLWSRQSVLMVHHCCTICPERCGNVCRLTAHHVNPIPPVTPSISIYMVSQSTLNPWWDRPCLTKCWNSLWWLTRHYNINAVWYNCICSLGINLIAFMLTITFSFVGCMGYYCCTVPLFVIAGIILQRKLWFTMV